MDTEKNIATGAAIGIVATLAASKLAKTKGQDITENNLAQDAQIIASTFLGSDIPNIDDAIEEYVKTLTNTPGTECSTFADIVAVIERSNELHEKTIEEAVLEAEQSVSPDIVSLNHIIAHSEELMEITGNWSRMDYEHERLIASIPRPVYEKAVAEAHANGVALGYYDENGGLSDEYVANIHQQIMDEKEAAMNAEENAPVIVDDATVVETIEDNYDKKEYDIINEFDAEIDESDFDLEDHSDTFFTDIAERISSPIGDEVAAFEEIHESSSDVPNLSDVIPQVIVDDEAQLEEIINEEECTTVEEQTNEDNTIDEIAFDQQNTQELPPVEIPPQEVLEILEPEPVEVPTEPIVMDPNDVVEAIVEEAADAELDDEVVAEVVENMAEEMIEAAELDPEECKSFTDKFMAVEIGEDGHAHPKLSDSNDIIEENKAEDFSSLYDVEETGTIYEEDAEEVVDIEDETDDLQEATEEILGLAAKTRAAIKDAIKNPDER